jgi:ADP-ribosylation factor-binding protein GGA
VLKLDAQSGVEMEPKQSRGITQAGEVFHADDKTRKVETVKLRYRLDYTLGAEAKNETGAVSEFSIA